MKGEKMFSPIEFDYFGFRIGSGNLINMLHKKLLLIFLFALLENMAFCQLKPNEKMPVFKGGEEAFVKYLYSVPYPLLALDKGIMGKVLIYFIIDSLDANKVINNTRQILGRIPGLNIVETESGGFTANGIATRGLNPIQSI